MSQMSNNLRDIGAFGVRVLSGYLGKAVLPRKAEYHSVRETILNKQVKSQLVVSLCRVGCFSPRREKLNVWGSSPLAVHYGSHPLTGVVSHPVYKTRLTAPTGRGVTKRPA